jgi:HEAT repeats
MTIVNLQSILLGAILAAGAATDSVAQRVPPAAPAVPAPPIVSVVPDLPGPPVLPFLPLPPVPPVPPVVSITPDAPFLPFQPFLPLPPDLPFAFEPFASDFAFPLMPPMPPFSPSLSVELQQPRPGPQPRPVRAPRPGSSASAGEQLYREARELIDEGRFERAIQQLDRLAGLAAAANAARADAALYWKAYAQGKLAQAAEALATISEMQKRFPDSRWGKDARALEVQIRQASGQAVSPDAQADEELKLLALRGLMQTDADRALGMIEQLLAGNSSVRVKENALFVLSQSRSPRSREIIRNVAKASGSNPDLQLRAVRYLGAIGGADNRQLLDEVYRSTNDLAIKRAILRSLMTAGDRERLVSLARSESAAELRAEAIQQLGAMRATTELADLYRTEAVVEVKRRLLQAMAASGMFDRIAELTKTEKDPQLRRLAVRNLAAMGAVRSGEQLRSIYVSETDADVRREVVNALFAQQNPEVLVALARAEKDPAMKRDIVSKLSVMKSKVAVDYMLELLK